MFVELHVLQNFAPSNLNRDETGVPKNCQFGGHDRARISSQCLKRTAREGFDLLGLIPPENRAVRAKGLAIRVADLLVPRGEDATPEQTTAWDEAMRLAVQAIGCCGLKEDDQRKGELQYVVPLAVTTVKRLAEVCRKHREPLLLLAEGSGRRGNQPRGNIPPELLAASKVIKKEVDPLLFGDKIADIALFGRMVADRPEKNVDGACQVAHAISTHEVGEEFDFFTAVDELKGPESKGAAMMDTTQFNSACYYRYANVDLRQLAKQLGDDPELAKATLETFLSASISAVPTGKQHGTAAQCQPSFVFLVARVKGLWSLANAFLKPVQPDQEWDLMENSIRALDTYWGRLTDMYGEDDFEGKTEGEARKRCWCATLHPNALENMKDANTDPADKTKRLTVQGALAEVMKAADFGCKTGRP
ncbi:MAG: type I-E CRISPR-associated protein Cas7/Cse4/CasC [Chloroflexi bacterium]|nr:type I-E CRISPR-associated protein Cas7/Cse4/CasC [Chloroflexota bacterium]MCL5110889.1 type I-E CRISPR-associated protein Cas7/Cse4/CasC [Chloroflexota bacterium]